MVWIQEVVVVMMGGVMVAGVEVVVIGVNREGGQRRGEIGRRTDGLEVKKMIGRVRADEDGEIKVRGESTRRAVTGGAGDLGCWDGLGWDDQALAEGGVGRGLWSLIFGPVVPGLW